LERNTMDEVGSDDLRDSNDGGLYSGSPGGFISASKKEIIPLLVVHLHAIK